MNIAKTAFDDLYILELLSFNDNRGEFIKTVHKETFDLAGLDWTFTESFYSISKKNVLRGMHFQVPPEDHAKLVYVITGKIIDVVIDLRKGPQYGKYYSIELTGSNRTALYVGKGFAHGFISLEENTIVEYHTTTSQSKKCEGGILWDSFGYNWPVKQPVLSVRDTEFISFDTFKSPF